MATSNQRATRQSYEYSPSREIAFRGQVPSGGSPGHRQKATSPVRRGSWNKETAIRGMDEEQTLQQRGFLMSSSPRSKNGMPVSPTWNPGAASTSWCPRQVPRRKLTVPVGRNSPPVEQLVSIKNQWNAQRDIPSGAVRNNPFLPRQEPPTPPSPRLVHQKKPWENFEIPRGSVAMRASTMDRGDQSQSRVFDPHRKFPGSPHRMSFTSSNHVVGFEHRVQGSSTPQQAMPASPARQGLSNKSPRQTVPVSSMEPEKTTHRGGRVSSPFLPQQKEKLPSSFGSSSRYRAWEPSREVPKGTVKNRLSSLRGNKVGYEERKGQIGTDEDHDEDPWIIPSKISAKVLKGDWGQAVPTKSSDSEEWDNPSKDWLGVPDSQEKDSRRDRPFMFGADEKKFNEPEMSSIGQDFDVLEKTTREKKHLDSFGDPFETVNARDMDILMAAKQKSNPNVRRQYPEKPPLLAPPAKDALHYRSSKSKNTKVPTKTAIDMKQQLFSNEDSFNNGFASQFIQNNYQLNDIVSMPKGNTCEPESLVLDFRVEETVSEPVELDKQESNDDAFFDAASTHADLSLGTEDAVSMESGDKLTIQESSVLRIEEGRKPKKLKKGFFKFFAKTQKASTKTKMKAQKAPRFSFGSSPRSKDLKKTSSFPTKSVSPACQLEGEKERVSLRSPSESIDRGGLPRVVQQAQGENWNVRAAIGETTNPTSFQDLEQQDSSLHDTLLVLDDDSLVLDSGPICQDNARPTENQQLEREKFMASDDNDTGDRAVDGYNATSPRTKVPSAGRREEFMASDDNDTEDRAVAECDATSPRTKIPSAGRTNQIDEADKIESWQARIGTPPPPPPPRQQSAQLEKKTEPVSSDPGLNNNDMDGSSDVDSGNLNTASEKPQKLNIQTDSSVAMERKKVKTERIQRFRSSSHRTEQASSSILVATVPSHQHAVNITGSWKGARIGSSSHSSDHHRTPKFTSRHAKIKSNLTPSHKMARRPELAETAQASSRGKTFPRSKHRSKARDYARQRAGYSSPSPQIHVEFSASAGSADSRTLASIGTDIRVLRSILRRPRKTPISEIVVRPKAEFPSYDLDSADPMQRAGMKLLSTAIIPIQTEVRRFLAMRHALTRMWALIVIQSHARQWIARKRYVQTITSAVTIQAMIRGRLARDDLDYKHVCAIEIQRIMRGYLATMSVYEDIYKVTMVQSFVRMKLEMDKATLKLAHVIQLQSVARGFLVRRRREYQHICAVAIQANWRRFYTRLNYQFDLLDIIIAQNAWRKRVAIRKVEQMCSEKMVRSATIIQAKWRQYDCTMNYLHYLADILIAQSALRRYLARKRVLQIRSDHARTIQTVARGYLCRTALEQQLAARKIQSAWRGFVSYADYMFSIADIVTVQKTARVWLASRAAIQIRSGAATTIQKHWRRLVKKTEFQVMKLENRAATVIQSHWRRFWCFSNFIIALDCSIRIQSAFRGYLHRKKLASLHSMATTIQSTYRQYASKLEVVRLTEVQEFTRVSKTIAKKERNAATHIQAFVRSAQTRSAFKAFIAARRIQAFWRCKNLHHAYKYYKSAVTIQSSFRAMKAKQDILILRGEVLAATLIQSAWRGFVSYTDYIFTVSDIIATQKVVRGFIARRKNGAQIARKVTEVREKRNASVSIQKGCRGFISRQRYWYTLGCTMQIQSWIRGRLVMLQLNREEKARLVLQCFARQCFARQEYLQRKFIFMLIQTAEKERSKKVAALVIQEKCRTYLDQKRKDEAARVIQRFFIMVRQEVDQLVRAAKRRKNWRKKRNQKQSERGEDTLLEDAWLDAVSDSNLENESFFSQNISTLGSNSSKEFTGSQVQNCHRQPGSLGSHTMPAASGKRKNTGKQNRLPPPYSEDQSKYRRPLPDNDCSEYSPITASTSTFYRLPQTRKKMDPHAMSEDLELEEAYMDTEICNAKDRRIADKHAAAESVLSRKLHPNSLLLP